MRDLASIVSVRTVWALTGKDRVQGCNFNENNFEAMVGKEIQPSDKVAYIQEGSILPIMPCWEFLRKRCFRESLNGFLIKPQKFCDIKSWGLVVSLNDLPLDKKVIDKLKIGDDITDLLNIRKYEPDEDRSPTKAEQDSKFIKYLKRFRFFRWLFKKFGIIHTKTSGAFPSDIISKSDETLLHNLRPSFLEEHSCFPVYISSKMEGKSFSLIPVVNDKTCKRVYICSRNQAYIKDGGNDFWEALKKYNIEKKIKDYYKETGILLVIQGEQVGPRIQENIYNFKSVKWYVYTMKDYFTGKQLSLEEMTKACKFLGLETVPILMELNCMAERFKTIKDFEDFVENLKWVKDNNGNIVSIMECKDKKALPHEGIVVRSKNYDKDNNVGFSFKVKSINYQEMGIKEIHKKCVEYFGD